MSIVQSALNPPLVQITETDYDGIVCDVGEPEHVTFMQTDEFGKHHTIIVSRGALAELLPVLNVWFQHSQST